MSFFAELKRRNVIRMAGLYLVGAWLIIQIAETLLPAFDVPGWVLRATIILLAIGFVPALIFSWVFELTPDGIKRDADVDAAQSIAGSTGRRMDRLLLLGMVAVVALIAADRFWPREVADSAVATDSAPADSAVAATDGSESVDDPTPGVQTQPVAKGIAVLPFANLSADPEQAFFADGITEDILTRLAGISGLRVISRTSVMRYKDTTLGVPEIAAQLGVSHILEGSVRRAGDRVRITGQLIRADDDAHLWADSFDRDLEDIFTLQTEIAGRIVEALELQLTDGETRRLQQRGTDSVSAYEKYLKGRSVFSRTYSNPEEVQAMAQEALRWFRAALADDPGYAAAEAGVFDALRFSLSTTPLEQRAEVLATATEAARRAIRLAPEQADGYVRLGAVHVIEGDEAAALTQFRKAADIAPDDPDTAAALADLHARQGRLVDAIRLARHALAMEPLEANRLDDLAGYLRQIGLPDQSAEAFERAWGELTLHPARRECMVAVVVMTKGDRARAGAALERARALEPGSPFFAQCAAFILTWQRDSTWLSTLSDEHRAYLEERDPLSLAWAVTQSGDVARLQRLLAAAQRQLSDGLPRASGADLAYDLGKIAIFRDQPEQALDHLEQAIEKGARGYRVLALDPAWDPIRDDPRFIALEARVDADLERMRAELAAMDAAP